MRTLLISLLMIASSAWAQKNSELEKAQRDLAAKRYPEALKSIDAAEKKGGLDHDSYMTLLESRALAEASMKKLDKAEDSFRQLLELDPRRDMVGKYKGDVVTALEWVKKNGGLEVTVLEPGVEAGRVKQVSVSVKNDPLSLAKAARIYVKQDGAPGSRSRWRSPTAWPPPTPTGRGSSTGSRCSTRRRTSCCSSARRFGR